MFFLMIVLSLVPTQARNVHHGLQRRNADAGLFGALFGRFLERGHDIEEYEYEEYDFHDFDQYFDVSINQFQFQV